jgi:hypothetical protein
LNYLLWKGKRKKRNFAFGVDGMCWTHLKLENICETEELLSLRRFNCTICSGRLELAEILRCVAEAAERMPACLMSAAVKRNELF